ncbi:hypothetical protein N9O56_00685 [Rickettsiales bacterium]|nr:hypothetical protein [Rickettsiales bacterium]
MNFKELIITSIIATIVGSIASFLQSIVMSFYNKNREKKRIIHNYEEANLIKLKKISENIQYALRYIFPDELLMNQKIYALGIENIIMDKFKDFNLKIAKLYLRTIEDPKINLYIDEINNDIDTINNQKEGLKERNIDTFINNILNFSSNIEILTERHNHIIEYLKNNKTENESKNLEESIKNIKNKYNQKKNILKIRDRGSYSLKNFDSREAMKKFKEQQKEKLEFVKNMVF